MPPKPSTLDPRRRFTDRADDYVRFRPGYPRGILDALSQVCGFDSGWVVADVGSGTGLLALPFLENGNTVHCVEPNAAMREAGVRVLGSFANFASVDGAAEDTGLADASVDLVTAGQAFHWFDPPPTAREFARILRSDGWVALVWNERCFDTPFNRDYDALLTRWAPEYKTIIGRHADPAVLKQFFRDGAYELRQFDNAQLLDLEGLLGRVTSSSYCPRPGDPNYEPLMDGLSELFERDSREGTVELTYDTGVYCGRV